MVRAVGYHEDGSGYPYVQFVSVSFRLLLVVEIKYPPGGVPDGITTFAIPQHEQTWFIG
jgi:hypothetical protein